MINFHKTAADANRLQALVGTLAEQEAPRTIGALREAAPERADLHELRNVAAWVHANGSRAQSLAIAKAVGEIEGLRALLGIGGAS